MHQWITHSQSVNHGLEAHVHFPTSDDLGYIGGIVGLQKGNLQALILKISPSLSQVQGGMVRGRMP